MMRHIRSGGVYASISQYTGTLLETVFVVKCRNPEPAAGALAGDLDDFSDSRMEENVSADS